MSISSFRVHTPTLKEYKDVVRRLLIMENIWPQTGKKLNEGYWHVNYHAWKTWLPST